MDSNSIEATIKFCLKEMSARFDQAASTARAALICADTGSVSKAVEIVLDVEQLSYEAMNLLNAASTLNHIEQS